MASPKRDLMEPASGKAYDSSDTEVDVTSILQNIDTYVTEGAAAYLAGPDEVTVDDTANGKTLATLLGAALETSLNNLTLIIHDGVISFAAGNATFGTNDLIPGVWNFRVTKTQADTFKFVADTGANIKMTVIQGG